jgi:hypothetical protein
MKKTEFAQSSNYMHPAGSKMNKALPVSTMAECKITNLPRMNVAFSFLLTMDWVIKKIRAALTREVRESQKTVQAAILRTNEADGG